MEEDDETDEYSHVLLTDDTLLEPFSDESDIVVKVMIVLSNDFVKVFLICFMCICKHIQ